MDPCAEKKNSLSSSLDQETFVVARCRAWTGGSTGGAILTSKVWGVPPEGRSEISKNLLLSSGVEGAVIIPAFCWDETVSRLSCHEQTTNQILKIIHVHPTNVLCVLKQACCCRTQAWVGDSRLATTQELHRLESEIIAD